MKVEVLKGYFVFFFIKLLNRSDRLKRNFVTLLDIWDFYFWVKSMFPNAYFIATRNKLFRLISRQNSTFVGVEFGVASGAITKFFFHSDGQKIFAWYGFDTFTGLPRAWRHLPKGHFSQDGEPPNKPKDSRVRWIVGPVEKTLDLHILDLKSSLPIVFLFDLDLFEPSYYVWNRIKHQLKPGDILYFDQAFDKDERKLVRDFVLNYSEFEMLGFTCLGLCLIHK